VQVRNAVPRLLEEFAASCEGGIAEFSVSSEELRRLLERVVSYGAEVVLVEPRRKDLESFFSTSLPGAEDDDPEPVCPAFSAFVILGVYYPTIFAPFNSVDDHTLNQYAH